MSQVILDCGDPSCPCALHRPNSNLGPSADVRLGNRLAKANLQMRACLKIALSRGEWTPGLLDDELSQSESAEAEAKKAGWL